jgi:hypothetical protein
MRHQLVPILLAIAPGLGLAQTHQLGPEPGVLNINYGQAVGVDSEYIVIGAPNGGTVGSVYIYDRATGSLRFQVEGQYGVGWSQLGFGSALALEGGHAVIGAPHGGIAPYAGTAALFDCATGQHIAHLNGFMAMGPSRFGSSIDMDESAIIVGAPGDASHGAQSGSALLFDAGTGAFLSKLTPIGSQAGQLFGYSVALKGNLAIVGAPGVGAAGPMSGGAYIFDVSSGAQLAHLVPSDNGPRQRFGNSIAIANGLALIGAELDGDNGVAAGAAYLYDTSTFSLMYKLKPSDGGPRDFFGYSVAMDGSTAVVSAPWDGPGLDYTGSVYLFDTSTGAQIEKVLPAQPTLFENFGGAVDISGSSMAVGSSFLNGGSSGTESAFVKNIPNLGTSYCLGDSSGATCPCSNYGSSGQGCTNGSGSGATLTANGAAYAATDDFTLIASGAPSNPPGLFFQGTTQVGLPLGNGILCTNATLRYSITPTDAAGQAVQHGLNANAVEGATLNYQYWFRDQGGPCSAAFNFTGGWTVTWF